MTQTLRRFHKSVKLSAADPAAALPLRQELDARVQAAAASLIDPQSGLNCTSAEDNGAREVCITHPEFEIVITTRCGQDTAFRSGGKVSLVSYTVAATASLQAYDKAASISEGMRIALRIVGAVVFLALILWGFDAAARALGYMRIPIYFLMLAVLAGAWLGERVGSWLGGKLEERSMARALDRGSLPQLDAVWLSLEHKLNSILKEYAAT